MVLPVVVTKGRQVLKDVGMEAVVANPDSDGCAPDGKSDALRCPVGQGTARMLRCLCFYLGYKLRL
jgi:hypothetical protein